MSFSSRLPLEVAHFIVIDDLVETVSHKDCAEKLWFFFSSVPKKKIPRTCNALV